MVENIRDGLFDGANPSHLNIYLFINIIIEQGIRNNADTVSYDIVTSPQSPVTKNPLYTECLSTFLGSPHP